MFLEFSTIRILKPNQRNRQRDVIGLTASEPSETGIVPTTLSALAPHLQGLGTSDCKTELCTRHLVANSSIDRRAQPQIAVERFAVLEFRRSLAIGTLAIGCAKAL